MEFKDATAKNGLLLAFLASLLALYVLVPLDFKIDLYFLHPTLKACLCVSVLTILAGVYLYALNYVVLKDSSERYHRYRPLRVKAEVVVIGLGLSLPLIIINLAAITKIMRLSAAIHLPPIMQVVLLLILTFISLIAWTSGFSVKKRKFREHLFNEYQIIHQKFIKNLDEIVSLNRRVSAIMMLDDHIDECASYVLRMVIHTKDSVMYEEAYGESFYHHYSLGAIQFLGILDKHDIAIIESIGNEKERALREFPKYTLNETRDLIRMALPVMDKMYKYMAISANKADGELYDEFV